jgi:hypothetical protein
MLQAKAKKEGKTLVDVLWSAACDDRDMRAMSMIWDRIEGKVPEKMEVAETLARDEFLVGLKSRIGSYTANGNGNGHVDGADQGGDPR